MVISLKSILACSTEASHTGLEKNMREMKGLLNFRMNYSCKHYFFIRENSKRFLCIIQSLFGKLKKIIPRMDYETTGCISLSEVYFNSYIHRMSAVPS